MVVVIAIPDIPAYIDGKDKTMLVTVHEGRTVKDSRSFSCLEAAERWVRSTWPNIREHPRTDPPTPIDGQYHDDPEVQWVGVV